MRRNALALLLVFGFAASASSQTIRFQTSVGAFDMLLNPTNNAGVQPLVDNMIANVTAGVYRNTVINRAVDDFVLQIGSFMSSATNVESTPFFGFDPVNAFDPVVVDADNDGQIDFDRSSLTNTRGTVSLALNAAGPNSGSSSFFVNLDNNSFLDSQGFVPFATVSDLSTVERIMGLEKLDLSAAVQQSGSLAYTDVPVSSNGDLVIIESVAVVSDSNLPFTGPLRTAFGVDNPPVVTDESLADEIDDLPSEEEIAAFTGIDFVSNRRGKQQRQFGRCNRSPRANRSNASACSAG